MEPRSKPSATICRTWAGSMMPMLRCPSLRKHAPRVARRGLEQFVAAEHPAADEVGAAARLNGGDGLQEMLPVCRDLEGNQRPRLVVENHQAEQVVRAEIADGDLGRRLGALQRVAAHGPTAVQHEAKGRRCRPGRGAFRGFQCASRSPGRTLHAPSLEAC